MSFSFWIPWEIKMLGGNEFRLRQGFGRRPKRLYGAKAPRPRRAVGRTPVHSPRLKIWILTVSSKTKGNCFRSCLLFWAPPPRGRLHPSVIEMLGGNEFRLRQGFGRRPKRLYGAKAPRPRRAVGRTPVHSPRLKIWILTAPHTSTAPRTWPMGWLSTRSACPS